MAQTVMQSESTVHMPYLSGLSKAIFRFADLARAGVGMLLMGAVSVLAMKRDAASLKTFSLASAVIVGLLSWSFVTQVSQSLLLAIRVRRRCR